MTFLFYEILAFLDIYLILVSQKTPVTRDFPYKKSSCRLQKAFMKSSMDTTGLQSENAMSTIYL